MTTYKATAAEDEMKKFWKCGALGFCVEAAWED